jgi:hypothetical protein
MNKDVDQRYTYSLRGIRKSEPVVVHFDPVPVRILEVDLLDLVGPDGDFFLFTGEIPVFHAECIQVFHKIRQGGDGKCHMYVNVVGNIFFRAADHMELAVFGYFKPDMAVVVKGFGDGIQQHDFFIKFRSAGQVGDVHGNMIKAGFALGPAMQGKSEHQYKSGAFQQSFHEYQFGI